MKKNFGTLVLAAIILLSIQGSARAIIFLDRWGGYLAGSTSWDWYTSNSVELEVNTIPAFSNSGSVRPGSGANVNLALGYYLNQCRIEFEGNYRQRKDNISFTSGGETVTDFGMVAKLSAMANAYYDIQMIERFGLYLGGGVGVGFTDIEVKGPINATYDSARFTFQLMAGMYYNLNRCVVVTFGYRLFGITSPEVQDFGRVSGAPIKTGVTVKTHDTPLAQSLELGIRINL